MDNYSSLGKFSHIEFISSPWVLNSITNKLMINQFLLILMHGCKI